MTNIHLWFRTLGIVVLMIGVPASRVAAQDVAAMAKWTAYTVVHYKVVGEYSGLTPVLAGGGTYSQAKVTDRVEFELDWNQQEFKLVGTPRIRNFPSQVGAIAPGPNCPPPRIEGAFELMTLRALNADGPMSMSGVVTLDATRNHPAGAYALLNEYDECDWKAIGAKSEAVPVAFQLPPAMSLAMPGGAPYAWSADGKSLIFKGDGWVWTSTPRGVK